MDTGARWARALLGLLIVAALPAMASNFNFMRDTPFSYFKEDDMKVFQANLVQALSEAHDNEVRAWSNPKTQSGGKITPLNSRTQTDGICRDVSIVNEAGGRTNKGRYTFCRHEGGEWKMRMQKPK